MFHSAMRIFNGLFLLILLSLCYIIARSVVFYNKDHDKENKRFWARESESNFVRKKDISNLEYILIPTEVLPLALLLKCKLDSIHKTLMELSQKKILNLSGYTNTDLKMMYGPANLPVLSECDENYTVLIRTLHKAATSLLNIKESEFSSADATGENADAAIKFLEYSVSIGSDMSNTYELLGVLYSKRNDQKALKELTKQASNLTSISKKMIISKLNNIKTS